MINYKLTNTATGNYLVTDERGLKGLLAAHTAKMNNLEAMMITGVVEAALKNGEPWEPTGRNMRVEPTSLAVNENPQQP